VTDVYTHHNGLDGITIGNGSTPPAAPMPHTLVRVRSEYNGRQGISWGGWGLTAIDCQFDHTGRVVNHGGGVDDGLPLRSAPSAGLDIEPNQGSFARDGHFIRCEFVDNAGSGLTADKGVHYGSTFEDCTFWGTTNYSIWANRPGLRFVNSRIYGTAVNLHDGHTDDAPTVPIAAMATYFEGCTFEDRPWTDGTVRRAGALVNVGPSEGEGVTFRDCTFHNHQVRAVSIGGDTTQEIFEGCTFVHDDPDLAARTAQSSFAGSTLRSVHFTEGTSVSSGSRLYSIATSNVSVLAPHAGDAPTRVDGPAVRWRTPDGVTGAIAPGTY
jgi:hypothetical protein